MAWPWGSNPRLSPRAIFEHINATDETKMYYSKKRELFTIYLLTECYCY